MSCVDISRMPIGLQTTALTLPTMAFHQPWSNASLTINSPIAPPSRPQASSSKRFSSRGFASEIIPRLYISDLCFAENPSLLRSYRISHILSTLPENIAIPPETQLSPQPQRLQINVEDFPFAELAIHLPQTTEFIRSALHNDPEARVLVHCAEGISRSVSVVAAYLMAQFNWSPQQAVEYIKERRRVANPNFGFVQQLHEYGRDVLGQATNPPQHSVFSPSS